jgi:predicted Zn-dependent peptidase
MEKTVHKVSLANGLRLILVDRPESPTLAIYTKFLVGAVDESPEISGTAHLLEHMLFKGTPNIGTVDYSREKKYQDQIEVWGSKLDQLRLQKRSLEEKGASVPESLNTQIATFTKRLKNLHRLQDPFILKNEDSYIYEQAGQTGFNAYTSQDVTNYQIQLPSNRLEIWAKMESDRLKNPVLREYYTEREIIIEERRMRTENSGSALLRERFMAVAMESHPYMRPVIGYPSVIPFLDIFETKDFFKKNYHPGNMVITIVGQQDFKETEKIVRKYFESIPVGPKRKESKILEIQSPGRKELEVYFPSGESILYGWRKPTLPHSDNAVFDVLDAILAKGENSRLYKRLVLETGLASSVSASNGFPGERYSNLFIISIRNNQNADIKKIESILWEELDSILKNGVPEEEIQKVKNAAISDFFRYMDSNSALADTIGYYELLTGDWRDLFRIYGMMNSVDSKMIQAAIQKYLTKDKITVGYLKDSRTSVESSVEKGI